MKQFVTKVTVTGADDTVEPIQLFELAEEFPFVEFGILLSRSSKGKSRFPSSRWIERLIYENDSNCGRQVSFSGHICGSWVREILGGDWPFSEFASIDEGFMSSRMFQRFQINTHAEPHCVDYDKVSELLRVLASNGQSIIFQYDDVNTELVKQAIERRHNNASALFDLSHGAGVLPRFWPRPIPDFPCGYAGGLSPENVADQLSKLELIVGDTPIWIDAETHLRSVRFEHQDPRSCNGDVFDLNKVRAFLQAAQPWVSTLDSDL